MRRQSVSRMREIRTYGLKGSFRKRNCALPRLRFTNDLETVDVCRGGRAERQEVVGKI